MNQPNLPRSFRPGRTAKNSPPVARLIISLVLFVFAASGCGPDEAELAATADAMIAAAVVETVGARPTALPQTTLTPLPTLTNAPTFTPQPAYTAQATLTARPTLTAMPTYTPPPSATETATGTATTTSPPVSTSVPQPAQVLFDVAVVNTTVYWMQQVEYTLFESCRQIGPNGQCVSYSTLDCPASVNNYDSFQHTILRNPGTEDPQIVGLHSQYLHLTEIYQAFVVPALNNCRQQLGLAPLPLATTGQGSYGSIYELILALSDIRSVLENLGT